MLTTIRSLIRPAKRPVVVEADYRLHEGLKLPPLHFRQCTVQFKDDAYFIETARRDVQLLTEYAGLTTESCVLDIGCGAGRLAIGLLAALGDVKAYRGLDVDARAIEWTRRHIQGERPHFRFDRLDVYNERYNPSGKVLLNDRFELPVELGWADVINLYSVFTHMLEADVRTYLREFARVLSPRGVVFCTAYVEPNVPDVVENPADFESTFPTAGPLHRVRFSDTHFARMVADAGLRVAACRHRAEFDHQSGLYLCRADATPEGAR